MIVYNSHHFRSLVRLPGSVFPTAFKWAAAAGIASLVLKICQNNYLPEGLMGDLEISPAAYSGFSFTLGFVIVFRTSQCYNRFWTCATGVNSMRAQWYEAASSLTTFIATSHKSLEEQDRFCHKVIRYFSLLHSLALQALADGEESFPVIDLESLPVDSLNLVLECGKDQEGLSGRVELVYQWIQALVIQSMESGLLNVPAPILTRVLQQMEMGTVAYNQVLNIMSIPFPFPYAQVTFILLTFYVCFIPIVMCLLVAEPWIAAICGFLSVLCLISVDLVSTEIENPFGEDANDLPCHEFQDKMNKALLNLLHPAANEPPELCDCAKMTYEELLQSSSEFTISDINAQTFHGGKLKKKPKSVEPKPIPEVKERKEKLAARAAPDSQTFSSQSAPVVLSVKVEGQSSVPELDKSAGLKKQVPEGALTLPAVPEPPDSYKEMMQQSTMLRDFVSSNGAMLERLDRTLNSLTTGLTEQLSSLSELQLRQMQQRALEMEAGNYADRNMSRNSQAGEMVKSRRCGVEVPPCLTWGSLLSIPTSSPGIPRAGGQTTGLSNEGRGRSPEPRVTVNPNR